MHSTFLLASGPYAPGSVVVGLIYQSLVVVVGFVAVATFVTGKLALRCVDTIPPEHRKISGEQLRLLFIPGFNLVWNFVVFRRVAASFKSSFEALGDTNVGDCGRVAGLAHGLFLVAMTVLPCAGLAALVMLPTIDAMVICLGVVIVMCPVGIIGSLISGIVLHLQLTMLRRRLLDASRGAA